MIGKNYGPLWEHLMQLASSHKGAGNGGHARAEGETGVNAVKSGFRAHISQHDQAHQGRCAAAKAVEKGHQLRHLDHLDLVGKK